MTEHQLCEDPACGTCAQARATAAFRGAPVDDPQEVTSVVTCPQCSHRFVPPPTDPIRVTESTDVATEARINGQRSFDDIRELLRKAVIARLTAELDQYCWAYIVDITPTDLVYMAESDRLYQCSYTIVGDEVTLGEAVPVERTYAPVSAETAATEATRTTVDAGVRVLEAKGVDGDGNRIFRVLILRYGDSKNRRRYSEAVMRKAAPLYEGAKAYDHHRSEEEMRSGTIVGLVGYYRNVEAGAAGIEADLHLLPSARHAAEALDAALTQETGDPMVGISHDVWARWRSVQENGRTIEDATEITSVNSADLVAHPAAGGQATRAVAGGINPDDPAGTAPTGRSTKGTDVAPTAADVLAALKEATDDQLAEVGLARSGAAKSTETRATESGEGQATEAGPAKVTEVDLQSKSTFLGRLLIKSKVEDAGLPASFVESITDTLPDRFSESMVDGQIAAVKTALASVERAGLIPPATAQVTQEAHDKKVKALDAFFDGNFREGYRSFRHAFADISGRSPRVFDEDVNRLVLRESVGHHYDSASRSTESLTATSWAQVLGDSITRRMVKLYSQPSLQSWREVVSDIVPVNDFREQKRVRIGGYGTLPTVNQGAPYQPLTSPGDEEAVYAVIKRGGTEDLTLEMIANDDIGAIRNIPRLLGLAAAITLYRFVWDIFPTNAATSFDATALFHSSHNNTTAAALSQTALTAARAKMRKQAAYGDAVNILSLVPKLLIVPTDLEELAFQLCTSAVAIPGTSNDPADRPNIHQGLKPIVIDYWTDVNDWFLAADPLMCPTIEIGFYQGREDPELFTQSDPNVGSSFDADKITYKIRHIYHGTPVEYRGLSRNTA